MSIIPNSLTKKAKIDFFVSKTKNLAKEMEEYFFGKRIEDFSDEVNVKEILRPIKEDTESHKSYFPTLSRKDKVIAMLSRYLRVVSATLGQLNNDDDENVNELLKSTGI